ncbi:MAG: hypothetical protein ABIF10_00150 [Candidatus Woesearchaeota archaeon]
MPVKIKKINPFKPDKRGLAYGFTTRPSRYFIVVHRKRGTVSAKHHHKGLAKSRNPETFCLIYGTMRLYTKNLRTKKEQEHIITENHLVEIPAMVYHELHAVTDMIFIEFHNLDDSKSYDKDTVSKLRIS